MVNNWNCELIYLSKITEMEPQATDHISSNKRQASNKRCPLISTASMSIYIEISASPITSAAPLNAAFIRIVTILYQ